MYIEVKYNQPKKRGSTSFFNEIINFRQKYGHFRHIEKKFRQKNGGFRHKR